MKYLSKEFSVQEYLPPPRPTYIAFLCTFTRLCPIQLVLQAQILKKGAGLQYGSRSSVVRASTAKDGGLGFDSQWLPMHFFFSLFLS